MKASRLSHMLFVVFFCSPDDFDTCGSFRGGKIKKVCFKEFGGNGT